MQILIGKHVAHDLMSHLCFCPARECVGGNSIAVSYGRDSLSAYLLSNVFHFLPGDQGRSLIRVVF